MKILFWIALPILLAVAVPSVVFWVRYLASGDEAQRALALRFYRWSALVVLTTFNIAIFSHIVQTIIDW